MTDDPRIDVVARVVAVPVHAYTDRATADGGRIPWDCDGCRELAAEALAAADGVDPLRDESFGALVALVERIIDRHYPDEVFTDEYSGPRDRGARFVAALRAALADLDPEPVPDD